MNPVRSAVRLARRALGTHQLPALIERPIPDADSAACKLSQLILADRYRARADEQKPLSQLADAEFRAFSQNGEDGILLYLFSILGMGGRKVIEMCAGDGVQCNATNLIINHGWAGLLFDGALASVERGRRFYAKHPDTFSLPPRFVHDWITRENVNQLIEREGWTGEIDLFSLDVDGVDYWIWDALEIVQPRVVVVEFQCLWGAETAVTVPYSPEFKGEYSQGFGVYSGASLAAFVRLAARKGYRLVGVQRLGFNAFFVRNGLADDLLPAVDPVAALDLPFVKWAERELLPLVKDKPWEHV
jgi:hypothetical protein